MVYKWNTGWCSETCSRASKLPVYSKCIKSDHAIMEQICYEFTAHHTSEKYEHEKRLIWM